MEVVRCTEFAPTCRLYLTGYFSEYTSISWLTSSSVQFPYGSGFLVSITWKNIDKGYLVCENCRIVCFIHYSGSVLSLSPVGRQIASFVRLMFNMVPPLNWKVTKLHRLQLITPTSGVVYLFNSNREKLSWLGQVTSLLRVGH